MLFEINIVSADVTILLSIDDMDLLGIYLDNLQDDLKHPASGQDDSIKIKNEHPLVHWDDFFKCFFR